MEVTLDYGTKREVTEQEPSTMKSVLRRPPLGRMISGCSVIPAPSFNLSIHLTIHSSTVP
jgi:hypothetical protein